MSLDNYIKDVSKHITKKEYSQEVSPGQGRRYEPPGGTRKHNERIHKESKISDNKNLPFSFRKPPKSLGRPTGIECPSCGKCISLNTTTVAVICSGCNKFFKVEALNE